jgi:DNA end-binding protein Ku
MAGLGRMVIRAKEYQCLIRPKGDALALETLFLAEDVHSQAEIDEAVEGVDVRDNELDLARQVIASLAEDFDPTVLQSRYRRDLRALLDAKLKGETISVPEPQPEEPVVDLLEALKRSVADAQQRKTAAASEKSGSEKPARASSRKR